MSTTVQEVGPFERRLTLTLAAADIEEAQARAARRLAQEINIKGFRPGKAPRPLVEATVGLARMRTEAIEDLLPARVGEALFESELRPAVAPALEGVREVINGVEVDVLVTLWPTLEEVPEYAGRAVEIPSQELTDEELTGQIDRLREQYASLETVERPAASGDYVAIDIAAEHNGLLVEEAGARDLLYEVGSGGFIDGIDERLEGKGAGETFGFGGPLPAGFGDKAGLPVAFTVSVTEVKRKVLPELSDEWVAENTEYETIADLRTDLTTRLSVAKKRALWSAFRELAFETLVNEVAVEVPPALLRAEMDETLHRFGHRLGESGLKFEDYLAVTGITEEQFVADLERQAERNIRGQLLLEAVARKEGLVVEDHEVATAVARVAAASKDPEEVRRRLGEPERDLALRSDILRGKALAAISAKARPVDAGGNPVDLAAPPAEEVPAIEGLETPDEDLRPYLEEAELEP